MQLFLMRYSLVFVDAQNKAYLDRHPDQLLRSSSCTTVDFVACVSAGDDVFRLVQATGVSSAVWLIGRLASPGRTEHR